MTWGIALALLGCTSAEERAQQRLHTEAPTLATEAAAVRDALIRGDVSDARARAGRLADALPATAGASGVKLALSDVRRATTLEDASGALGQLASACAACHREAGAAIPSPAPQQDHGPPHAPAAALLWSGLIGPSDALVAEAVAAIEGPLRSDPESAWHTAEIEARTHELAAAMRTAAADQRPAQLGPLLVACATCHLAGAAPARPRIDGVPLPDLRTTMLDHFVWAMSLEMAVSDGDLERAKQAATGLVTVLRQGSFPDAARERLAAIEQAAAAVDAATTPGEVARATAALQAACAECHKITGGGPTDPVPAAAPETPGPNTHAFGAYWLGYGLLAPDERAWTLGASVLADAPLPEGEPAEAFHALGQRAVAAAGRERVEVWGEMLATCAPCHARSR